MKQVDLYIDDFPEEVQVRLRQVRDTILEAAPGVEETFAYMMPAYRLNGPLVYFAGFGKHIGFTPLPPESKHSKGRSPVTNMPKGRYSFRTTNPCPWI